MDIHRIALNQRLSKASIAGGVAYLSGQTCSEAFTDFSDETAKLLNKIDGLLEESGTSKSSLLHVGIYLSDLRFYDEFNTLWDSWIDPANIPSRTCVEARLPRKECRVELSVIAATGQGG